MQTNEVVDLQEETETGGYEPESEPQEHQSTRGLKAKPKEDDLPTALQSFVQATGVQEH